ncbi:IS630 family transposase [Orientia tsutsugamushi]|uniref:IS630 family transposase n=1 Tax=Orientia tsutsugamushi TaxID=784 RepID=A0A2U3RBL2_ORITS|nr:putative transposase [Orientia tsutsugamushi str. UT76]SPR10597.1 IS630 family transposase [Orientia tsutsugamushi]
MLRSEFIEKVKQISKENLVFIDESGIEDNDCREYGWSIKGNGNYNGQRLNDIFLLKVNLLLIIQNLENIGINVRLIALSICLNLGRFFGVDKRVNVLFVLI